MTKDERETILRWDESSDVVELYTANASTARKWERLGFPMTPISKNTKGDVTGWIGQATKDRVSVRRRRSADTPKRKAPAALIAYQKNRKAHTDS